MPPGLEAIIPDIVKTIFSQYGVVVVLLLGTNWLTWRSLTEERRSHAETNGKLFEVSEATVRAIEKFQTLLEFIAHDRRADRRGRSS